MTKTVNLIKRLRTFGEDVSSVAVRLEAAEELERLQRRDALFREWYTTMRAISWRLFADQGKGEEHWSMTPDEQAAMSRVNAALDAELGPYKPPATPENLARATEWGMPCSALESSE